MWVLASNSSALEFYAAMGFTSDRVERVATVPVPMSETRLRLALDAG